MLTRSNGSGGMDDVLSSYPEMRFIAMITKAIPAVQKGRNGATLKEIMKYIKRNYTVQASSLKQSVERAMQQGIESGSFALVSSKESPSRFRIAAVKAVKPKGKDEDKKAKRKRKEKSQKITKMKAKSVEPKSVKAKSANTKSVKAKSVRTKSVKTKSVRTKGNPRRSKSVIVKSMKTVKVKFVKSKISKSARAK